MSGSVVCPRCGAESTASFETSVGPVVCSRCRNVISLRPSLAIDAVSPRRKPRKSSVIGSSFGLLLVTAVAVTVGYYAQYLSREHRIYNDYILPVQTVLEDVMSAARHNEADFLEQVVASEVDPNRRGVIMASVRRLGQMDPREKPSVVRPITGDTPLLVEWPVRDRTSGAEELINVEMIRAGSGWRLLDVRIQPAADRTD